MQLAAWGKVDTGRGNAIDMTLGIPGPSLLPLGLTDLPEDYIFMIPMRGTSQHPVIDIVRQGLLALAPSDMLLEYQKSHFSDEHIV